MAFSFTLCADDYGMTSGVSDGILEVACAGRISAASAMTAMPDWPRAAAAWRDASPPADLGLHLNLTVGRPLGPMRSLAPEGALPSIGAIARGTGVVRAEIAAEIDRQIDAFVAHAGTAPTHLDGHQHVHALPAVRDALLDVLKGRGMEGVVLRNSADLPVRIIRRRAAIAKALGVAVLTRGFAAAANAAGFACNDGFAGFSRFERTADLRDLFARYLTAPGRRHLVMCHPGNVDDALRALDPVTDAREAELRFLLSPDWPALMEERGARFSLRTAEGRAS